MDNIYKQHQPQGGNDLYLKLKDGDKVRLRVVSEPAVTLFKEGDKPRYAWIMWNRELKKPQIFGAGVSIYGQIADLVEDWGDPTTFDITIKRTGSGQTDTEYSVVPVKQSNDLTEAEQAEVDKINLPQACKGKWLKDYVKDGKLPAPISDGGGQYATSVDEVAPMPSDADAPIDLDSIPFN